MNVDDLLKLTMEERVRHLELYGTANVDSWIVELSKRIDELSARVGTLERLMPGPAR